MPRSLITPVANALVKANLKDVPFWIAHPGMPQNDAVSQIATASGPFPVIGFQIRFENTTDFSVFSTEWLNKRSGSIVTAIKAELPPGPWNDPKAFDCKDAVIVLHGLDNNLHTFTFNPGTGRWTKLA